MHALGTKSREKMLIRFMIEVASGEGEGGMVLGWKARGFNFILFIYLFKSS